jgi:hypothetical protein
VSAYGYQVAIHPFKPVRFSLTSLRGLERAAQKQRICSVQPLSFAALDKPYFEEEAV